MTNSLDGLDITNQVLLFRDFLNNSWDDLDELMYDHDWEEDGYFSDEWVQVNWELLVEREITQNTACLSALWMHNLNDRITHPNKKCDYLLLVKPKNNKKIHDLFKGNEIDFSFDVRLFGLCKAHNPGFGLYPPFDFCNVCVDKTKKSYIVPFKKLKIYLKKVP